MAINGSAGANAFSGQAAMNQANAAAAAASNGAAAPASGGLRAWWGGLWSQHGTVVHQRVTGAVTGLRKTQFKMPVDVQIDFIKPAFNTLRETVTHMWVQLPPPVQQAAPFVGVAVGGGLVVYTVQQRRLNYQKARNAELKREVAGLQKERADLMRRMTTLKANRAPRTETEARLAAAVAEATNAAAAAADAAARAATACIIQRPT